MVLNHAQRIYSKKVIQQIFRMGLKTENDVERAMVILDDLYSKYKIRTEIYLELEKILLKEFDIDVMTLYGVILKDIDTLFKVGLDHMDMFIPTDLDVDG